MSCERVREQIPELLAGHLDAAAREKLVEHLEGCAGCRTEVAELNAAWRAMESLKIENQDAPDQAAKARFMEVLDAYRAGMGVAVMQTARRRPWYAARPLWEAALAAGLLAGGIFAGRYLGQPKGEEMAVVQLKEQVENLRQMVALSMMQQQSPSARMRGVSYSEEMTQPDRQVQQALLSAVNHDSNVNVRLSAVDALQKYAGDPEVMRAMVDAIPVQDSPLVQIALIDLLAQVNARSAVPALTRLTKDAQAHEEVRQRAQWAIEKLGGMR